MATRPTALVSIDGGPLTPGSLTIERDVLLHWEGDIEGFHHPGNPNRVMVVTGHRVYFGEALVNRASAPASDSDERPVSHFLGTGELHRKDLREAADLLFATIGGEG